MFEQYVDVDRFEKTLIDIYARLEVMKDILLNRGLVDQETYKYKLENYIKEITKQVEEENKKLLEEIKQKYPKLAHLFNDVEG